MFLSSLEVTNFRNLKNQLVRFSSPVTLLVGENGQGKTSLIEACYLLSQGKSFRTSKPRELVRFGETHTNITGVISNILGQRKLSVEIINGRTKILIEDKKIKSAEEFYGSVQAVSFVPSDLELVSGAACERRRFVDRTLSMIDSKYVKELVSFERALKNKAALLKSKEVNKSLYEPWNALLIRHGLEITKLRAAFISDIRQNFNEVSQNFVNKPCSVDYESAFTGESEENLHKNFREILSREIAAQRNLIGPHRDDVIIKLDDKNAREFSSQGRTRALALALKISALRAVERLTEYVPILLLDDVESELDEKRKAALSEIILNHVLKQNGQVIITSTSSEGLSLKDKTTLMRVESGYVT